MFIKMQCLFVLLIVTFVSSRIFEEKKIEEDEHGRLENMIKALELLKIRSDLYDKQFDLDRKRESSRQIIKPEFDIRTDAFPEHCQTKTTPSNCAEATECTERSGYYIISIEEDRSFLAYCDYNFQQGDWLYILRRTNGLENFQRSWDDYVKGFGNVDNEYWIGLDNLYALTNLDGPQELYVNFEDVTERTSYAKYDYIVIGNASEKYQLKALGSYSGTAADNLSNLISANFSTPDSVENDTELKECVVRRNCGWWFKMPDCPDSALTGSYSRYIFGGVNKYGTFWKGCYDDNYYIKKSTLMIRRQRSKN